MQLQPAKKALKALSLLTSTLAEDTLTDKQRIHIAEALEALAENPDSVSINRSQLEIVWPDSERYLGADKSGQLVVLITPSHQRQKKKLSTLISRCGVLPQRISIISSDNHGVESMVNSRHCRAIIYMRGCPKELINILSRETSVMLSGLKDHEVRGALAQLKEKLR